MTLEHLEQTLQVRQMTHEAQGVVSVELVPANPGAILAPFTAGSHLDLHLPNGLVRSYSLLNSQAEAHRYVVAVYRDPKSRGGSEYVHQSLRVGQTIIAAGPRNRFPLADAGTRHVFFAGGIGITPILSMVEKLSSEKRRWHLLYSAQTRDRAAFIPQLEEIVDRGGGELELHFDDEHQGRMRDIAAEVSRWGSDAHFYCCGPAGMIEAFKVACADRSPDHVHFEFFAVDAHAATEKGFTVVLARSGRRIAIPSGQTVLETLLSVGVDVSYSCQQGICGACETRVIAGTPDHRDQILTEEERGRGETMMICCSGALSEELTLDL